MRSTSAISTPVDPTFSALMKGTEVSTRITSEPTETITVDPEATMYFSPTNSVVDESVREKNKDSGGNFDEKVPAIAVTFVGGLVIVVVISVLVFKRRCKQPPEGNSSEEPLPRSPDSDNITSNELVPIEHRCDESRHDAPGSPCQRHDLQDMTQQIRSDICQSENRLGQQVAGVEDQVAELRGELAKHANQPGNNNNASKVRTSSSQTETVL